MAKGRHIYRVQFHNAQQLYEVYVREVENSDIFGFIEIRDFVFGKPTQLVIDPSDDKVRSEFGEVDRTMIPLHAVVRIDEVKKEGPAKITETEGGNVTPFPMPIHKKTP